MDNSRMQLYFPYPILLFYNELLTFCGVLKNYFLSISESQVNLINYFSEN